VRANNQARTNGRTYEEQRFSPLDQINISNVQNLALPAPQPLAQIDSIRRCVIKRANEDKALALN
jgi:hypothetical protein